MRFINELINFVENLNPKIIYTLLIIAIFFIIKWLLNKIIKHNVNNPSSRYKWRKFSTYTLYSGGLLLLFPIWLKGTDVVTFLGLFTAGLAIALRDLLSGLVGWIYILWKKPFSIGDRIEIDGKAGDIIDISIFQFSIIEIGEWVGADQSTGRVVHIPNKKILDVSLANYTENFPFIWNELPVLLTFESDWEKAKYILLEIIREINEEQLEAARSVIKSSHSKYMIYYGTLTPIVYSSVQESGILLTIRYLCKPQERRNTSSRTWEQILHRFSLEDNIDFAYPTRRFYVKGEVPNFFQESIREPENE